MMEGISTIAKMKEAIADVLNYGGPGGTKAIKEDALFWAQVSQALAAERQAAALERIADTNEQGVRALFAIATEINKVSTSTALGRIAAVLESMGPK